MYLVLIDLEIVTLKEDIKVNQIKLPFQVIPSGAILHDCEWFPALWWSMIMAWVKVWCLSDFLFTMLYFITIPICIKRCMRSGQLVQLAGLHVWHLSHLEPHTPMDEEKAEAFNSCFGSVFRSVGRIGLPGPKSQRIWSARFSVCGHWNCKGLAQYPQVHGAWWSSSQSTAGPSGCHGRTPFHHLSKAMGVCGGSCWLEGGQWYSNLEECEEKPRKSKTFV